MDTNFLGPVRVNRAVLPHMRRQRSGLLMHISSGAGRVVLPSAGFYCASKFALEALAESYSYEPVSYTHLDVYKRQVPVLGGLFSFVTAAAPMDLARRRLQC